MEEVAEHFHTEDVDAKDAMGTKLDQLYLATPWEELVRAQNI